MITCPKCNSNNIKKAGFRYFKNKTRQRYQCRCCKRVFQLNYAKTANKKDHTDLITRSFSEGKPPKEISKELGVSLSTVYRVKKKLNCEKAFS